MGVLSCDRNGCENIMCDYHYYSNDHSSYYICNDCREEFISEYGSIKFNSKDEVRMALDIFMGRFCNEDKFQDSEDMINDVIEPIDKGNE